AAVPANIHIGDVIERVTHAIANEPSTGLPTVRTETYRAEFETDGLRFAPNRPWEEQEGTLISEPNESASLRTRAIRQGDRIFFTDNWRAGPVQDNWVITGNTAQTLRSRTPEIVEHYEARSEGVEVTWVLKERPAVHAPLRIEMELDGLAHLTQSEQGHHFADAS